MSSNTGRWSSVVQFLRVVARLAVTLSAAVVLAGPSASAQEGLFYGTVVGNVTDTSGAVVPGAKVTATNTATGISNSATTDSQGFYQITRLIQGPYLVTVEHPGFKSFVRAGVTLNEAQVVRVNATLQVGGVKQTVQVTASTPLINTESGQLSDTMTWAERKYLPTASPNFFSTLSLYPGADTDTNAGYPTSFAGSGEANYNYSIDGQTFRDPYGGYNASVGNFDEWMATQTVNYLDNSAQYKEPGDVNVTTKNGTNTLHGSGVWYYTSGGLKGRNPFSPTKPPGVLQVFAGSIGGPIRRGKAFFFAAYSGNRNHSAELFTDTVPTVSMKQGDFSEISTPIINPYTDTAFPGNVVPQSLLSPVSMKFLNTYYPNPNFGTGFFAGNYRANHTQDVADDDFVSREDYRFSDKDTMFVRYNYDEQNRGALWSSPSIPTIGPRLGYRRDQNLTLNDLYNISPSLFNEFSVGGSRDRNSIEPTSSYSPSANGLIAEASPVPALPGFAIGNGVTEASQTGWYDDVGETWTIQDNLTWMKGHHQFMAGFYYLRGNDDGDFGGSGTDAMGVFGFSGWPAATYGTFTGPPMFEMGLPYTEFRYAPGAWFTVPLMSRNSYEAFVQDNIQVTSKLTIDLGLRYNYFTPWSERYGRLGTFDLTGNGDMVVPNATAEKLLDPGIFISYPTEVLTASQAGYPTDAVNYSELNFDPRLGFAYRLLPSTVIRGGYGIFHDMDPPDTTAADSLSFYEAFQYLPDNSFTNGAPLYSFPNPFAIAATSGTGTLGPAGGPKNEKIPAAQQWNLTVEHQFPRNTALRVSYVASRYTDQLYSYDINLPHFVAPGTPLSQGDTQADRPYPLYGGITWAQNGAGSFYNAFMVEVTHRTGGFWFDSHYTWVRDLGIGTTDGNDYLQNGVGVYNPFDVMQDYGNLSFEPTNQWVTTYGYHLPFGQGQHFGSSLPKGLNELVSGWQATGIFNISSGDWLSLSYSGYDPVGSPNSEFSSGRPDRICNGNIPGGGTQHEWFDVGCFTIPGASRATPLTPPSYYIGRLGNSGVGIIEGPGWWQYDMGLTKGFKVGERWNVHLGALATNLFNHPNLADPATDITTTTTVGQITAIRSDGDASGIGMRQLQLFLRIEF